MKYTLISIFGIVAFSSCSQSPFGRSATTGATTAVGSYAGYKLGNDSPEGAVLGAVGGYTIGKVTEKSSEKAMNKAYDEGYNEGRAQTAKMDYWKLREDHISSDSEYEGDKKLYEIPVPEHVTADGTKIDPHYRVVEIID